MDVTEFIDLHVHIGPEVLPRRFTVPTLTEAEAGRIAGLALKNHFYPTTPLIETAPPGDDLLLVGSVTLNNYVGGLNPDAVYGMALLAELPPIVWLPTLTIDHFLAQTDYEIPAEWLSFAGVEADDPEAAIAELDWVRPASDIDPIHVTDDDGELTPEVRAVLAAVEANDAVLATGHLAWEDSAVVVREAVDLGIESVIVTHPIWQLIDMPVDVQADLAALDGVYMEHNYAMHSIDDIPMARIADQIDAVGPEDCIVSSDMGQKTSPAPSEAMSTFADGLLAEGLDEAAVRTMGADNPRRILGLA